MSDGKKKKKNSAQSESSSEHHHNGQIVRTTGLLQNNLSVALTAHLDLVNLNTENVEVRVQVLNWGNAVTQTNPVSTLLDETLTLAANTRTAFNALITASNHYEVRLTVLNNNNNNNNNSHHHHHHHHHRINQNVLLTTYGRTSIGGGQVVGLSVLDSQFQTVVLEND